MPKNGKKGRPAGRGKKLGITIPHDLDSVFDELSELSGVPKATLIADYLVTVQPHFEKTVGYMRMLKNHEITLDDAKKFFFDMLADYNNQVSDAIRLINEN